MRTATRAERAGHWPRNDAAGAVTLAYDERHRRRLRLTTDAGEAFLLDLPRAAVLEAGDGLALDDGRWIEVRAAPEALVEVTAEDAGLLGRLAWHLGNRHLPARIEPGRILIRADHVICDMLRGLGARLRSVNEPFTPERGAYETAAPHGHHHEH
ncbi:MAG: urease accessory protein UreE [Acidobacteriota bacterium]